MQTVFKSEQEFEQFKEWTYGLLCDAKAENLRIVFTKKDGTERTMRCTLVESQIPGDKLPKTHTEESDSQTARSAVRVYDLDKGEWRSFRWDSVIKVEVGV